MYKCSACNNSDTFEDDDQDIYEYDESNMMKRSLFGIIILQSLTKR